MPETIKTGFILPNGMFISNAGNGHPHTAKMFLHNSALSETEFIEDMNNTDMPWEDAIIMAGAIALATRRQSDGTIKSHIRGFEKSFLTEAQEIAVEWLEENEGYVFLAGWKYQEDWGNHLQEALNAHENELNYLPWTENFGIVEKENL